MVSVVLISNLLATLLIVLLVAAWWKGNKAGGQVDKVAESVHLESTMVSLQDNKRKLAGPNRNPRVILHVGPHKTGSSVIQNFSVYLQKEMLLDGYTLPPVIPPLKKLLPKNLDDIARSLCEELPRKKLTNESWPVFLDFLDRSSQQDNLTVFLSAEDFDQPCLNMSKLSNLVTERYDPSSVRVVVVYRRLFHWLRSKYQQKYKSGHYEQFISFVQYMRKILRTHWELSTQPFVLAKRYEEYFPDVQIVNLEDKETTLLTNFFCNSIRLDDSADEDVSAACERVREIQADKKIHTKNVSPNFRSYEIRRVIWVSKKRGLLDDDTEIDREEFSKKLDVFLADKFNTTINDLTKDCLETDLVTLLWNKTRFAEGQLLPEWFGRPGGHDDLKDEFDDFMQSGILCAIDWEQLLMKEAFRDFLLSFTESEADQ